jgi:hypothetical protein
LGGLLFVYWLCWRRRLPILEGIYLALLAIFVFKFSIGLHYLVWITVVLLLMESLRRSVIYVVLGSMSVFAGFLALAVRGGYLGGYGMGAGQAGLSLGVAHAVFLALWAYLVYLFADRVRGALSGTHPEKAHLRSRQKA